VAHRFSTACVKIQERLEQLYISFTLHGSGKYSWHRGAHKQFHLTSLAAFEQILYSKMHTAEITASGYRLLHTGRRERIGAPACRTSMSLWFCAEEQCCCAARQCEGHSLPSKQRMGVKHTHQAA